MCFICDHQVRDSDPKDPKRDRIVQLIDDFRVSGVNGERILYRDRNCIACGACVACLSSIVLSNLLTNVLTHKQMLL